MSVSMRYDSNSRLLVDGLTCDCPCTHHVPTQDIYVGQDLLPRLPEMIARRAMGTRCLLVADDNTHRVAGQAVLQALTDAGLAVDTCILKRDGEVHPDERSCGEVLLSIQSDTEFLIAVGSGTITDTVRVNATRTGLPFVSVATAPSMDGYTSVVSPLLLRNVKIHRPGVCPDIIVCDLDILATAPLPMIACGVGDVLGKYIAKVDWMIGGIINDEPYCPTCASIVFDAVNRLADNVQAIRAKTREGMRILIEALLLSGLTILMIGNTRAVASIEHNIAQFWEMKQLQRGLTPPRHGSSVGVATLLVWPLYQRFYREDLSRLNLDAIRQNRIDPEERTRRMLYAYGEDGGGAIMRENPEDFLSWQEQERRIRRAQDRIGDIRCALDELPPLNKVRSTLQALGAPLTPADEGIDEELLGLSLRCGKDYRTRYTLLKTLDECGLLEEYLTGYPYAWPV